MCRKGTNNTQVSNVPWQMYPHAIHLLTCSRINIKFSPRLPLALLYSMLSPSASLAFIVPNTTINLLL